MRLEQLVSSVNVKRVSLTRKSCYRLEIQLSLHVSLSTDWKLTLDINSIKSNNIQYWAEESIGEGALRCSGDVVPLRIRIQ